MAVTELLLYPLGRATFGVAAVVRHRTPEVVIPRPSTRRYSRMSWHPEFVTIDHSPTLVCLARRKVERVAKGGGGVSVRDSSEECRGWRLIKADPQGRVEVLKSPPLCSVQKAAGGVLTQGVQCLPRRG